MKKLNIKTLRRFYKKEWRKYAVDSIWIIIVLPLLVDSIHRSQSRCKTCMEHGIHRFFDVVNVAIEEKDGKRILTREMDKTGSFWYGK